MLMVLPYRRKWREIGRLRPEGSSIGGCGKEPGSRPAYRPDRGSPGCSGTLLVCATSRSHDASAWAARGKCVPVRCSEPSDSCLAMAASFASPERSTRVAGPRTPKRPGPAKPSPGTSPTVASKVGSMPPCGPCAKNRAPTALATSRSRVPLVIRKRMLTRDGWRSRWACYPNEGPRTPPVSHRPVAPVLPGRRCERGRPGDLHQADRHVHGKIVVTLYRALRTIDCLTGGQTEGAGKRSAEGPIDQLLARSPREVRAQ